MIFFERPIRQTIQPLLKKKILFLTWDIAKSYNKEGVIKRGETNFLSKNLNAIKNIQLHDAVSRFRAGHEIIGTGFVDFKYFLNKTNLDVNYIIEVRPHVNVLKSRTNLIKLLKRK